MSSAAPLPRGPGGWGGLGVCRRGWPLGHGRAAAALSRPHPERLATFPTPVHPWGREGGAETESSRGPACRPLPHPPGIPRPGPPSSGGGQHRWPRAGRWAGGAKGRPRPVPPPAGPAPPCCCAEGGRGGAPRVSQPPALAAQLEAAERKVPGPGAGVAGRPGNSSPGGHFRSPPLGRSSGRRPERGLRPERGPPSFPWDSASGLCRGRGLSAPPWAAARSPPHPPTLGTAPQGLSAPVSEAGSLPFPLGFLEPAPPGEKPEGNLGLREGAQAQRCSSQAGRPDVDLGWGVGPGANPGGGGNSPRPGRWNGGNRGVV